MAYDSIMKHSTLRAGADVRLAGRILVACALLAVVACDNTLPEATTPAAVEQAPSVSAPETPATDAHAPSAKAPADATAPIVESKPAPIAEPAAKPVAEKPAAKEIEWFKGTLDEALVQARKENKLVFIDFWTTWCGWCKKLDKDTYTDPRVIAALTVHYVCLSVDAETKVGVPLARRYSVSGYPTLLMLMTDGNVRERIPGYKAPEPFLRIVLDATKPR
jgi:thiol-disulfide isomerase/thioredoxin